MNGDFRNGEGGGGRRQEGNGGHDKHCSFLSSKSNVSVRGKLLRALNSTWDWLVFGVFACWISCRGSTARLTVWCESLRSPAGAIVLVNLSREPSWGVRSG